VHLHYNALVFTLRPFREADFSRIMEIDHLCFIEGIAYPEDEMRYFLRLPTASTFVAADESGNAIGFIIADAFRPRRFSSVMGRIITIDVDPSVQKSGLGQLLLKHAEQYLKSAGCKEVILEVAVDNQSALRFYKKSGYAVMKSLPRYYMDTLDGLLMGKKL
jgi:ribosomal-protein-alanine N-acetyltransferase